MVSASPRFTAGVAISLMNIESTLSSDEQVLQWLKLVARRADALASRSYLVPAKARGIWLRAELEVFEEAERIARLAVLGAVA